MLLVYVLLVVPQFTYRKSQSLKIVIQGVDINRSESLIGYFYHPSGQEQLTVPKGLCLSELSHGSSDLAFYP